MPDELKPAYKQMQSAFTKKTQEIAEKSKLADSYKAEAEAFAKYKPYIPLIEEMSKNQGQQQSPEMAALEQDLRAQGYNDDAIDLMKRSMGFALGVFNQQRETEKTLSAIEQAAKLDARLQDKSLVYEVDGEQVTYGNIVEKYVLADSNWKKDPIAATQKAMKLVDALIGHGKVEGKKELSASASAKAQKFPATNSSPASATDGSQPKSIQEAYAQTKAELGLK